MTVPAQQEPPARGVPPDPGFPYRLVREGVLMSPEPGNVLPVDVTASADPAAALWAASSNPAIGTIDLASSLVASAADGIAWPKPPG